MAKALPLVLALLPVVVGCAAEAEHRAADGPPVLAGRVVFHGELPGAEHVDRAKRHKPPVEPQPPFRAGTDGGLAGAVVKIEADGGPAPAPLEVAMTLGHGGIDPVVVTVPAGGTVMFATADPGHNFALHTYARRNKAVNVSFRDGTYACTYERPEIVLVSDDVHPWLQGWIFVTDSPHTTVTDADGRFRFEGLEPGRHSLKIWHPVAGNREVDVELGTGDVPEIELGG